MSGTPTSSSGRGSGSGLPPKPASPAGSSPYRSASPPPLPPGPMEGGASHHPSVVTLTGDSLTPALLMAASHNSLVEISPEAWDRIRRGRESVLSFLAKGEVVYGVNTGFGSMASTIIAPEDMKQLQLNLIRSHAAGVGAPLTQERVRRLLVLRINVLCKGYSGISTENVERLLACLNANCLSWVPQIGSVGASGDLAPLSHLALGMLGEGEMWDPTASKYRDAAAVLADHGLEPLDLGAKEGLALINGTQFITSITAEAIVRAENLMHTSNIIAAITMEALRARPGPFEARVHDARGQTGQKLVAQRLRDLLDSDAHPSEIFRHSAHSVQDAYSVRCVPQVHGIVHETLEFVKRIICRELNAATDNPMVFPDKVISAGNFHGEYPAKCADYLAAAISELATISERRIERLINSHLSGPNPPKNNALTEDATGKTYKLPPFLVNEPGLNSGFMILHCTAAAIVVENRTLVHPTSCDNISTSAAQEDHVSMGAYAARKCLNVVENVERVLSIELMAACQGLDFLRPLRSTESIERVHALVRKHVPFWDRDMYAAGQLQKVIRLVQSGKVMREIDPSLREHAKAVRSSLARPMSFTSNVGMYKALRDLTHGIPTNPLPPNLGRVAGVPHAPKRGYKAPLDEKRLALRNALRYFPATMHGDLAVEFLDELEQYGHIYMYRFRPTRYEMKAYPISSYPARCRQAAAIMLMIQNNLDHRVAQYPHELVTYGGNGSAFSNWAQYHLTMKYLSEMSEEQTLVLQSGHPLGLFPSHKEAPRMVITNGMVVPNYSTRSDYERMYLTGVSQYGQMTAGSFCYIGPQGIVHGTTLTILNASRKYLGTSDMRGRVFVSAGLGGMSGAQAKAALICGAVGVIAEVNIDALRKRHEQGWVKEIITDLKHLLKRVREAREGKECVSIGYWGNVVDIWEALVTLDEDIVELGSDQTSCHNPFAGGYYPVQLSFDEANEMMAKEPAKFKGIVQESLRRHVAAINALAARGLKFWDYGNSFLLEASRAGAEVLKPGTEGAAHPVFRYPSYVEDIMGDVFSLGFGPFRWVCCSGVEEDLRATDRIAGDCTARLRDECSGKHAEMVKQHYEDNHKWIVDAMDNNLVVGSQARILYSDAEGRRDIALAFNRAIREGRISGPVVLSRDHHDVSGTDSPYRETTSIEDGSKFCADMAIQNVIGDSFRGATWVAIHNGGGTGWGEAINGGFGLVLDGSLEADDRAEMMLGWDVLNGVTRRAWSGHAGAQYTIKRAMRQRAGLRVTESVIPDDSVLAAALRSATSAEAEAGAGSGAGSA